MLRQTKFDHPSIPQDLVARPRLTGTLDQGLSRPLTLICAPAGYGKTILASSFLETCSLPSVWLALDENDNNLRVFLDYLLAAIDSAFPDSLRGTKVILAGTNLLLATCNVTAPVSGTCDPADSSTRYLLLNGFLMDLQAYFSYLASFLAGSAGSFLLTDLIAATTNALNGALLSQRPDYYKGKHLMMHRLDCWCNENSKNRRHLDIPYSC